MLKPSSTQPADFKDREAEVLLKLSGFNDAMMVALQDLYDHILYRQATIGLVTSMASGAFSALQSIKADFPCVDDIVESEHDYNHSPSIRLNFIIVVEGHPLRRQITIGRPGAEY